MPEQGHIDLLEEMIRYVWIGVYDFEPESDCVNLTVSGLGCWSREGHFLIPMAPFLEPVR
jgi:hypothetical protein